MRRPALRRFSLMQGLIAADADASIVDRKGRTPLHWLASGEENRNAAHMILRYWAEQEGRPTEVLPEAPLAKCVQLLTDHGA